MSVPRPRSVTLGCVYGGIGAVILALALIEALSNWGSLELQESLETGLRDYGRAADVDAILPVLRGVFMAMLVAAIAAAVFAVYAAKGHQASRIGLTVLSAAGGLLAVLAGIAGVLPAMVSGLVIYLLWSAPARHWYAVVNGRIPVSMGATPAVPVPPTGQQLNQPRDGSTVIVPPPPYVPPELADGSTRPRAVRLALMIAGIGSVVGAIGSGIVLLAVLLLHDQVVKEYQNSAFLREQLATAGLTAEQLVTFGSVVFGSWFVISLLGLAATAWAATGRRSGWWALVVASVLTSGAAALGLPIGLVWILGGIVVVVQLSRPEAKAWFQRP